MTSSLPTYLNLQYFFNLIYRAVFLGPTLATNEKFIFWIFVGAMIAILISLILIGLIIYVVVRTERLRQEKKMASVDKEAAALKTVVPDRNRDWDKIMKYLESDSPSDWKLAILESDSMLDKLVKRMNYPGESLGERLQAIEPSDFTTLNEAWEAHKVRNKIAHDHSFDLTKREVKRIVGLYEKVFEEFDYI